MATQNSQIDLGHWFLRLIAYVIDSIIIGIVAGIIYFFVFLTVVVSEFLLAWGSILVLPFIVGILAVLYFVILDVSWGATIGKRILGFQVKMVNGNKVDFGKAFIRNISKIHPLFLLLDWIIGIATPGADRRQKYADRIAGTTVVSIKQPFQAGAPPPPPPPPPT